MTGEWRSDNKYESESQEAVINANSQLLNALSRLDCQRADPYKATGNNRFGYDVPAGIFGNYGFKIMAKDEQSQITQASIWTNYDYILNGHQTGTWVSRFQFLQPFGYGSHPRLVLDSWGLPPELSQPLSGRRAPSGIPIEAFDISHQVFGRESGLNDLAFVDLDVALDAIEAAVHSVVTVPEIADRRVDGTRKFPKILGLLKKDQ